MNQKAKTKPLIDGSKVQRSDCQQRMNRHAGEDRSAFNGTMKQGLPLRLASTLLAETSEVWGTGKTYLNMENHNPALR